VKLEPQIKSQCEAFLTELVQIAEPDQRVETLASFMFGALCTLARQIDVLRAELITNDVEVTT
jgi:hypothetical protein